MPLVAALRSDVYHLLHVSCTYRNQNRSNVLGIRVVVIFQHLLCLNGRYLRVYVEHTVLWSGWLLEFWRLCRVLVQPQVVAVAHLLNPLQSLTVFHLGLCLQNSVIEKFSICLSACKRPSGGNVFNPCCLLFPLLVTTNELNIAEYLIS